MKKMILLLVITVLAPGIKAQQASATGVIQFPRDFTLPVAQVLPAGFIVEPLNKEAKEAGITANPGEPSQRFWQQLYNNADVSAIGNVYAAIYIKATDLKRNYPGEVGYNVVAYKSAAQLTAEVKKISVSNGERYFFRDNYLLIVWSDANGKPEQVAAIANYFSRKLQLKELNPPAADHSDITEEAQPAAAPAK